MIRSFFLASGIVNANLLPTISTLSTKISPLFFFMNSLQSINPIPVPDSLAAASKTTLFPKISICI